MENVDTNTLVIAEGEGVCALCENKIPVGENRLIISDNGNKLSVCDCCVVKEMVHMKAQQFSRCIVYERAKMQIVESELARALRYNLLHRKRGLDGEG